MDNFEDSRDSEDTQRCVDENFHQQLLLGENTATTNRNSESIDKTRRPEAAVTEKGSYSHSKIIVNTSNEADDIIDEVSEPADMMKDNIFLEQNQEIRPLLFYDSQQEGIDVIPVWDESINDFHLQKSLNSFESNELDFLQTVKDEDYTFSDPFPSYDIMDDFQVEHNPDFDEEMSEFLKWGDDSYPISDDNGAQSDPIEIIEGVESDTRMVESDRGSSSTSLQVRSFMHSNQYPRTPYKTYYDFSKFFKRTDIDEISRSSEKVLTALPSVIKHYESSTEANTNSGNISSKITEFSEGSSNLSFRQDPECSNDANRDLNSESSRGSIFQQLPNNSKVNEHFWGPGMFVGVTEENYFTDSAEESLLPEKDSSRCFLEKSHSERVGASGESETLAVDSILESSIEGNVEDDNTTEGPKKHDLTRTEKIGIEEHFSKSIENASATSQVPVHLEEENGTFLKWGNEIINNISFGNEKNKTLRHTDICGNLEGSKERFEKGSREEQHLSKSSQNESEVLTIAFEDNVWESLSRIFKRSSDEYEDGEQRDRNSQTAEVPREEKNSDHTYFIQQHDASQEAEIRESSRDSQDQQRESPEKECHEEVNSFYLVKESEAGVDECTDVVNEDEDCALTSASSEFALACNKPRTELGANNSSELEAAPITSSELNESDGQDIMEASTVKHCYRTSETYEKAGMHSVMMDDVFEKSEASPDQVVSGDLQRSEILMEIDVASTQFTTNEDTGKIGTPTEMGTDGYGDKNISNIFIPQASTSGYSAEIGNDASDNSNEPSDTKDHRSDEAPTETDFGKGMHSLMVEDITNSEFVNTVSERSEVFGKVSLPDEVVSWDHQSSEIPMEIDVASHQTTIGEDIGKDGTATETENDCYGNKNISNIEASTSGYSAEISNDASDNSNEPSDTKDHRSDEDPTETDFGKGMHSLIVEDITNSKLVNTVSERSEAFGKVSLPDEVVSWDPQSREIPIQIDVASHQTIIGEDIVKDGTATETENDCYDNKNISNIEASTNDYSAEVGKDANDNSNESSDTKDLTDEAPTETNFVNNESFPETDFPVDETSTSAKVGENWHSSLSDRNQFRSQRCCNESEKGDSRTDMDPSSSRTDADPPSSRTDTKPSSSRTDADPSSSRTDADPSSSRTDADPSSLRIDIDPSSQTTTSSPQSEEVKTLIEEAIETLKKKESFTIRDVISYVTKCSDSITFLRALLCAKTFLKEAIKTGLIVDKKGTYTVVGKVSPEKESVSRCRSLAVSLTRVIEPLPQRSQKTKLKSTNIPPVKPAKRDHSSEDNVSTLSTRSPKRSRKNKDITQGDHSSSYRLRSASKKLEKAESDLHPEVSPRKLRSRHN